MPGAEVIQSMEPLAPQVGFVSCRVLSLGRLGLRVPVPEIWEGGSETLMEIITERPRYAFYSFSSPTHLSALAQPVLVSIEELPWKSKAPNWQCKVATRKRRNYSVKLCQH